MEERGLRMADDIIRNPEKNREPLVSVLVPAYNHHQYIIECLESIRALNYKRLELIVSDDCSTDNTFELAEQWAQKNADRFERTLVVRQEKNAGLVRNLQFMFNNAQGDYIAYIASDDVYVESAIAARVEMLERNRDIDAVFGNVQEMSIDGAVIRNEHIPKWRARELSLSKLLTSSLILNFCVPGPSMVLRRKAVLEGGSLGQLPADLRVEDIYIYIRLAALGKLRFLNAIVAKYRILPGGLNLNRKNPSVRAEQHINTFAMNMHLLTGFNRFAMENRIARYKLERHKGKFAFYSLGVFAVRSVIILLRAILFTYAFVADPQKHHVAKPACQTIRSAVVD
jgi:alpha-1,3-rhamnosyltransferase